MKTAALAALASLALPAQAYFQLNYYSDASCNNYGGDISVTWAQSIYGGKSNCYNYQYGGSAKIANCPTGSCVCNFFYGQNCHGNFAFQSSGGTGSSSCAYQGGIGSFACYYK